MLRNLLLFVVLLPAQCVSLWVSHIPQLGWFALAGRLTFPGTTRPLTLQRFYAISGGGRLESGTPGIVQAWKELESRGKAFIEQLQGVSLPRACAGCHLSLTPRIPQPGVTIVPILPRSESPLGHAVTGDKDAHPVSADSRAHPVSLTGDTAPPTVLASLPCSHLISSDRQGIERSF